MLIEKRTSGNAQLGTYSGSYTLGATGGLTNDGDNGGDAQ
jgi:hypothetical protein